MGRPKKWARPSAGDIDQLGTPTIAIDGHDADLAIGGALGFAMFSCLSSSGFNSCLRVMELFWPRFSVGFAELWCCSMTPLAVPIPSFAPPWCPVDPLRKTDAIKSFLPRHQHSQSTRSGPNCLTSRRMSKLPFCSLVVEMARLAMRCKRTPKYPNVVQMGFGFVRPEALLRSHPAFWPLLLTF